MSIKNINIHNILEEMKLQNNKILSLFFHNNQLFNIEDYSITRSIV